MAAFPTFTFVFDVIGDSTAEKFSGNFEGKVRLSHRDQLNKDQLRRQIIGTNPEFATKDSHMRAEILGHLSVSLVDGPKWWKESGGGLDLFDDNVLFDIYEKVTQEQSKAIEDAIKKGEVAKEGLKKVAKKKDEAKEE
jgi:hypothetical protein